MNFQLNCGRFAHLIPGLATDQPPGCAPSCAPASANWAGVCLYFTFGLASFVLLIACADLANFQLVRSAGRWHELGVRAALGAGRARLMRQLLTDGLLVSALGGVFGLMLAALCNGVVSRSIEYLGELPLDARVLAFAMICSLATGILFGIAPAWMASRSDVNDALKDNHRAATSDRWQNWLRQALYHWPACARPRAPLRRGPVHSQAATTAPDRPRLAN